LKVGGFEGIGGEGVAPAVDLEACGLGEPGEVGHLGGAGEEHLADGSEIVCLKMLDRKGGGTVKHQDWMGWGRLFTTFEGDPGEIRIVCHGKALPRDGFLRGLSVTPPHGGWGFAASSTKEP
jgi:hypothetical protein